MKVGDKISGYTLLQECGKGTFGKVFLAEGMMGERVAFKAISALGTYAERELQALKSYQQCSRGTLLLQIYHANINEDYLFYVMEMADPAEEATSDRYIADTLDLRLERKGKLSVQETTNILVYLLNDLNTLHTHKLIHRDIKPANILFVNGNAKLGDIGLLAHDSSMTAAAGTPLYMPSPESGIKGNTIEADLYALAKVVYCCLSGNAPDKFPEIDITDDISSNGKELLKFINEACSSQKHFHSVADIWQKFPGYNLYAVLRNKLLPAKNENKAVTTKCEPPKNIIAKVFFAISAFYEQGHKRHPVIFLCLFGPLFWLGEVFGVLLGGPLIFLLEGIAYLFGKNKIKLKR